MSILLRIPAPQIGSQLMVEPERKKEAGYFKIYITLSGQSHMKLLIMRVARRNKKDKLPEDCQECSSNLVSRTKLPQTSALKSTTEECFVWKFKKMGQDSCYL